MADTSDIELQEIARGRRITAMAAKELDLVPRHTERPETLTGPQRLWRRAKFFVQKLWY